MSTSLWRWLFDDDAVRVSKVAQETADRVAAAAADHACLGTPASLLSFFFSFLFSFRAYPAFAFFFRRTVRDACRRRRVDDVGHALKDTQTHTHCRYGAPPTCSSDRRRFPSTAHVRCATPRATRPRCQPCDPIIELRGAAAGGIVFITCCKLLVSCFPPPDVVKTATSSSSSRASYFLDATLFFFFFFI